MKVVDFGKVIKRLRTLESITQSELVSLIDAAAGGETGVDTVSVSRWENNIITPSHRRQVEIVNSIGYELSELIEPDVISVCQEDLEMALNSRIIDAKYWDFTSTPCKKDNIEKKKLVSGELISYNFIDSATEIPIAHVTFKFEKKSITNEKTYMVIESIYCTIPSLLLDFISYFMHLVIKKKVDRVVYRSKNSKTPLNKFFKSIGFKILDKKDGKYMNTLSLSDVLYNQTYFNLACCYKNRIISS